MGNAASTADGGGTEVRQQGLRREGQKGDFLFYYYFFTDGVDVKGNYGTHCFDVFGKRCVRAV
jgi:hypothetical protein